MKNYNKIFIALALCMFPAATVQAQSGAPYEITQSVISNGGGTSGGGTYSVTGTVGQSLAGTISSGGQISVRGGFWQSFFTPTAAMVAVSGRVMTASGRGISKVRVRLTDAAGVTRPTMSSDFGYFRLDDIEVGQTYIISVQSKRYQFANPTQVVVVSDEITGLNFNALP